MIQQLLAIFIIIYFISRLTWQYRQQALARSEYRFWMFFWLVALVLVVSLKQIDRLVLSLGFSAPGIAVLTDFAIIILLYFIFRLRLRVAKLERDLTKVVEHLAIKR